MGEPRRSGNASDAATENPHGAAKASFRKGGGAGGRAAQDKLEAQQRLEVRAAKALAKAAAAGASTPLAGASTPGSNTPTSNTPTVANDNGVRETSQRAELRSAFDQPYPEFNQPDPERREAELRTAFDSFTLKYLPGASTPGSNAATVAHDNNDFGVRETSQRAGKLAKKPEFNPQASDGRAVGVIEMFKAVEQAKKTEFNPPAPGGREFAVKETSLAGEQVKRPDYKQIQAGDPDRREAELPSRPLSASSALSASSRKYRQEVGQAALDRLTSIMKKMEGEFDKAQASLEHDHARQQRQNADTDARIEAAQQACLANQDACTAQLNLISQRAKLQEEADTGESVEVETCPFQTQPDAE